MRRRRRRYGGGALAGDVIDFRGRGPWPVQPKLRVLNLRFTCGRIEGHFAYARRVPDEDNPTVSNLCLTGRWWYGRSYGQIINIPVEDYLWRDAGHSGPLPDVDAPERDLLDAFEAVLSMFIVSFAEDFNNSMAKKMVDVARKEGAEIIKEGAPPPLTVVGDEDEEEEPPRKKGEPRFAFHFFIDETDTAPRRLALAWRHDAEGVRRPLITWSARMPPPTFR